MCIVYGEQVWIMPLFKAVPLQLVDWAQPSICAVCGGNHFHFRVWRDCERGAVCFSPHHTHTHAVRTVFSTVKHCHSVLVVCERNSQTKFTCRVKLVCRGTRLLITLGTLVGRVVSAENATGSANTDRRNQCTMSMKNINTLQWAHNIIHQWFLSGRVVSVTQKCAAV